MRNTDNIYSKHVTITHIYMVEITDKLLILTY